MTIIGFGVVTCVSSAYASPHDEIQTLKKQVAELQAMVRELQHQQHHSQGLRMPHINHPLPPPQKVLHTQQQNNVRLGGQVNRLISQRSNGRKSRLEHLDNTASSTRLNITADAPALSGFHTSAIAEIELTDGNPAQGTRISESGIGGDTNTPLRARRLEVTLTHENWGKIWIGQGPTASDGTSEIDFSQTAMASNASEGPLNAGGINFHNRTHRKSDVRASEVYDNFDGLARANRIRYDTPQWHGLSLATTHTNQDQTDIALRYAHTWQGTQFAFAFAHAYSPFQKTHKFHQYNGSFGVLFPNGISIATAAGTRDYKRSKVTGTKRKNGQFQFAKLGYQHKIWDWGLTAFAIDFARGRAIRTVDIDHTTAGHERSRSYGIIAVQHIDPLALEVYAFVRGYTLHRRLEKFHKAYIAAFGTRFRF